MTTLETRPNGAAVAPEMPVRPRPVDQPAAPGAGVPQVDPVPTSRPDQGLSRWSKLRERSREKMRRPAAPPTVHPDDAMRMLHLVRRSRRAAVLLTVGIATVSFVLSFTSLQELAAMSAWPGWKSWLWPVILDGLIILATLGIVSLAPYRDQFWNRLFLWGVLGAAALVSIGGNSLHAWLATDHLVVWMRWGSAGLACAPPVALLATTHILAILWRFNPTPPADASSQAQASALAIAAERVDKWDAVAATIHEQGLLPSQSTAKIAEVLRYLYDERPTMSLRAIGEQVQLHHDKVGRIRDAAAAVLGRAGLGER